MLYSFLVHHFLEHSAERLPDKVALICADQRLTYREINEAANRLASNLVHMGIQHQDRVVIFLDNSAESVIALFAILKVGAIFLIVNPTMKAKKLNYILKDSGAKALITQPSKSRIVAQAAGIIYIMSIFDEAIPVSVELSEPTPGPDPQSALAILIDVIHCIVAYRVRLGRIQAVVSEQSSRLVQPVQPAQRPNPEFPAAVLVDRIHGVVR